MKKSQRDNHYFDMTLQMEHTIYRSVCFSPEKHHEFLTKYESSSPIKLTKYQIKRNARTNQDEVHINKRSKVDNAQESEVCFDIKILIQEQKCKPGVSNIMDVLEEVTNSVLNVCGRVTPQGSIQTVMSEGKALREQEAILTDNSGTIRLVLWENDISKDISKVHIHVIERCS